MKSSVQILSIFPTTLERAFKTPMLCDVRKIHSGYSVTPRVTHCTEDETWGKKGGTRKIFMAKTSTFEGGEASLDKVLERRENEYWKIEISDFKMPSMGLRNFRGNGLPNSLKRGKWKSFINIPCSPEACCFIPSTGFSPKLSGRIIWDMCWKTLKN